MVVLGLAPSGWAQGVERGIRSRWTRTPTLQGIADWPLAGQVGGQSFICNSARMSQLAQRRFRLEFTSAEQFPDSSDAQSEDAIRLSFDFTRFTDGRRFNMVMPMDHGSTAAGKPVAVHVPRDGRMVRLDYERWAVALRLEEWLPEPNPAPGEPAAVVRGRITLCLLDQTRSWVTGRFVAAYYGQVPPSDAGSGPQTGRRERSEPEPAALPSIDEIPDGWFAGRIAGQPCQARMGRIYAVPTVPRTYNLYLQDASAWDPVILAGQPDDVIEVRVVLSRVWELGPLERTWNYRQQGPRLASADYTCHVGEHNRIHLGSSAGIIRIDRWDVERVDATGAG